MSNIDPSFAGIASGNVPIIGQQQDPGVPRPTSLGVGKCYQVVLGCYVSANPLIVCVPDPARYEPCNVLMGLGNVQLPFAFYFDGKELVVLKNRTYISVPTQVSTVDEPPWWHLVEKWWKKNIIKGG